MYVCVCNAVTEQKIRSAVSSGLQSLRELREELGVARDCGRCARCAHGVVKEALSERSCQSGCDCAQ